MLDTRDDQHTFCNLRHIIIIRGNDTYKSTSCAGERKTGNVGDSQIDCNFVSRVTVEF